MPVDTVISNRDLVDDVPVQEEPRKQWTDKPTDRGGGGGVTNMQEQRSRRYAIDMYRAQSAAEGTRGNPQESSSSRDRSLSTSTRLSNRASDEGLNSHRLPMESLL